MRPTSLFSKPLWLISSLLATLPCTMGEERMLVSKALNSCQPNSQFAASLFKVMYTPDNNTALIEMLATSSVEGNVVFDFAISAYGYQFIKQTIDPCKVDPKATDSGLAGLCPMTAGKLKFDFNLPVPKDAATLIPGIAFTFPDLDATVTVFVNLTSTGESVACLEAEISNGKTVNLVAVKWILAIIAGLVLCSSALLNGLGYANAAAHIASGALSLFGFFQAQAMLGMSGIRLPPIVQSWTQDFQWSMGIINIDFMQNIFTWYQRATGGTPAQLFNSLATKSVQVQKRDVAAMAVGLLRRSSAMMPKAVTSMIKRANITTGSGSFLVYGIQRASFRAGIETTNLFMTGLTFFCLLVIFTSGGVAAFKGYCELAVKQKWMKPDTFLEFRNGWLTVLKGILFRLTLIGYPQMTVLCMWEFTQLDSPAEVVLAVFFFFGMTLTLSWAAWKVIRIARRSMAMHRNPAYILFSDPQALNKWGFLYIQFRASAYYFILPVLGYTFVKSALVAFGQHNGNAQAIGFLLTEAAALVTASVMRPWMDKSTNSFNIAIYAINFINSVFLLVFSDVFDQPKIVNGAIGLILFFMNAIFATVLLIMVIVTTAMVFYRKNPDARYQYMADDRASFMKSQTQLTGTTELEALGATARGDKSGYKATGVDLDDDSDSPHPNDRRADPNMGARPVLGTYNQSSSFSQGHSIQPPRSPISPSVPMLPAANGPSRSPSPYGAPQNAPQFRQQNNNSPAGLRHQNGAAPWQRGAGYDS
ncbi:Transient receptor potential (TRP) ion channel [Microdochium nivale]|nr:Transient receptor potential (TRP) ion channel [Microdochium nivale]